MTKNKLKYISCLLLISLISIYHIKCEETASEKRDISNDHKQTIVQEHDALFDKIPSIKLKHMDGLKKILNDTDMTYLVYYYKQTSENSRKGVPLLEAIANKLEFLAGVILVDCTTIVPNDVTMCVHDPEAKDGYPRMELYEPPAYRFNPYTKKQNFHTRKLYENREVSENLIYNFITQNIPSRSTKITLENYDNFISNIDLNKVILFTDKPKTPLLFRGISNFFYDRLMFGEVNKDQEALLKKFKIKTFPTLIVYQVHDDETPLDEPKIEYYTGKINARDIGYFINEYSLKDKLYLRAANDPSLDKMRYKVAVKYLNKDDLFNYMQKFQEKRFIVILSNTDDKQQALSEDISKLNMMTNGFFHFIHINCKKDFDTEQFCKTNFKIAGDRYPKVVLYNNDKGLNNISKRLETSGKILSGDYSDIADDLNKIYIADFKEANPQNFAQINSQASINKKVPFIFLMSEGEIPLGLYLLASEDRFKKYVEFVIYENPPESLLKNIKITKLPQLIALIADPVNKENARVLTYNEELVYPRLSNFINNYFNQEKNTKITHEEEVEKEDITFYSNNEVLNRKCLNGKRICLFGFLDGRSNKNSISHFDKGIKTLENVYQEAKSKGRPTNFGWVNATCQVIFFNLFLA